MTKKVGIWIGSSPAPKEDLKKGLAHLRALGFEPIFPRLSQKWATRPESKSRPFIAGPDSAKILAFRELWERNDIDSIFCVRGGYGTLRLLRGLDSIPLKARNFKKVWGFSDLTTLQHYLFHRFGGAWVHSPMLTSRSFFEAKSALEKAAWPQNNEGTELRLKVSVLSPAKAAALPSRAKLLGGNLACFITLMGTPWEPKPQQNFFLFLEDIGEKPYRLDRCLAQLGNAAFMKKCRAVFLGHFTDCGNAHAVIKLWAAEQNLPVYAGLPAGHDRPNVPITMGEVVKFLPSKNTALLIIPKPAL